MRSSKDFGTGCYSDNQKGEIQTRIWIETDRKISQGRWTEGQQRNNQKLHESGVEVEMETQKGAVANIRSEEKTVIIRAAAHIGNSKTGLMFYLVTIRRIKCSMFQTHAMTSFGVRKKKNECSCRLAGQV